MGIWKWHFEKGTVFPMGMDMQRALLGEAFRDFKYLFNVNDGAHTVAMIMYCF